MDCGGLGCGHARLAHKLREHHTELTADLATYRTVEIWGDAHLLMASAKAIGHGICVGAP